MLSFLPLSYKALRHWTRYGKQTALYGRYHSNCLILWFALGFPLPLSILFALLKVQSAINSKVAEKLHLSVFLLVLSIYMLLLFYCHPVPPFLKRINVFIQRGLPKKISKLHKFRLFCFALYFLPLFICYFSLTSNTIRMKK